MRKFNVLKLHSLDIDLIAIGKGYLSGLLGALTVFSVLHWYDVKPYKIGTVNITAMVNQFVKQEANKNLPQEVLKNEVKNFGGTLEKELREFSEQSHLVLLPSEAVIAGSKDYTVIVQERMVKKLQREDLPNVE